MATPTYILATPLQIFFIDKNTQKPLSGGIVSFYRDIDGITPKPVFKYTGTPGHPAFLPLENPIILTPQGTIGDESGNDVLFYWYPYDEDGNWDPYFVDVKDSEGGEQFTRHAMPYPSDPGGGGSTTTGDNYNYINNGQFLMHYDLPADGVYEAGEIRAPVTTVAYGNWTFNRPPSTGSKDLVQFERFGSFNINPEASPRYAMHVTCVTPQAGDGYKDIRFRIPNVNMFSTEAVTFTFEGQSDGSTDFTVFPGYRKFYGTGGKDPDEFIGKSANIVPFYKSFSATFAMPTNSGLSIGTLDDDYIEYFIRLPTAQASNGYYTNFSLVIGSFSSVIYIDQTPQEAISRTLAGVMDIPAYDGSNVGGVLRLQKDSISYDGDPDGVVKWYAGNPSQLPFSHLACDGAKYRSNGVSGDGISYSRLFGLLNIQWGNGYDYLTGSWTGNTDSNLRVINNEAGAVSPMVDGSIPTGFTFTTVKVGDTAVYNAILSINPNANTCVLKNTINAAVEEFNNRTAPLSFGTLQSGNAFRPQITTIAFTGIPTGGDFLTFQSSTKYYVWYTVNGSGTDPAPVGYTAIPVALLSTDNYQDLLLKTAAAINKEELTYIAPVAASAITAGSYFLAYSTGNEIYVWYSKGSSGVDPKVPGKIGIEVALNGDEDIGHVVGSTGLAMNEAFYQVPDVRGRFIVGMPLGSLDGDVGVRHSNNNAVWGDQWGTQGEDFLAAHLHDENAGYAEIHTDSGGSGVMDRGSTPVPQTSITGRYRNMVLNVGMTPIIKY